MLNISWINTAYFHVYGPDRFDVTTGRLQNQGYFPGVYYNNAGHRFYTICDVYIQLTL